MFVQMQAIVVNKLTENVVIYVPRHPKLLLKFGPVGAGAGATCCNLYAPRIYGNYAVKTISTCPGHTYVQVVHMLFKSYTCVAGMGCRSMLMVLPSHVDGG